MDSVAMRRMQIKDECQLALQKIGLGTMCTKHYEVYPELERQFMATVQLYYTSPEGRAQTLRS